MHRLALVAHPTRPLDSAVTPLRRWAAQHGIEVVQIAVRSDGGRVVATPSDADIGDLVVAIGGDGTVLSALRVAAPAGAPVLGVACGSLGALSAVGAGDLVGALDRFAAGEWTPRELSIMGVGDDDWAINDFVIVRRGPGQLVADLSVDDELYARIAGDGLVVATPVGSSAYSMSAGGPILAGGTAGLVCTPIAPHGGSVPPLVVPADAIVCVEAHPGYAGFDLEIDGHERHTDVLRWELQLRSDTLTLVTIDPPGRGLTALRRRGLVTDSPRVLARDQRTAGER